MKDYMDYYYSGSETEAEEDGESNILKDFFGDDKGNSSDGEQQTPETEIPYIDDTPYGSDPYSGSSPMTQAPTAAVLLMEAVLMEVIPMEVILTADRILPPLRDRQFKQT
ncbi:MAG: hypothetical protein ACLR2E_12120 [Lachnospiraceae bacterium]